MFDIQPGYLLAQVFAGILAADFISGVIHWLEDAYGREDMPFIGARVIEPNIRHHYSPLDFTRSSYLKRNGPVLMIAIAVALILAVLGGLNAFTTTLLLVGSQANETHRWAHMRSDDLPGVVRLLQRLGLLVSQRHHGRHHRAPFAVRYCTVTSLVNPVADGLKLFVMTEFLITFVTGIERRKDTGKRPAARRYDRHLRTE